MVQLPEYIFQSSGIKAVLQTVSIWLWLFKLHWYCTGIFNRTGWTLSFLVKMLSLLENPSELWCICAPVLSYAVAFYQLESFVASANNFVASFGLLLVVLLGFLLLFYFVVLGFLFFFFLIVLQPFFLPLYSNSKLWITSWCLSSRKFLQRYNIRWFMHFFLV